MQSDNYRINAGLFTHTRHSQEYPDPLGGYPAQSLAPDPYSARVREHSDIPPLPPPHFAPQPQYRARLRKPLLIALILIIVL